MNSNNFIEELRPYNSNLWKQKFPQTNIYQTIIHNFKHVVYTFREVTLLKSALHHDVYEFPRKFCDDYFILDAVPYYYIEYLTEICPKTIIDIGCGINVFKKFFPIIGIDNNIESNFDVFDTFDEDYVNGHRNAFDALITINTIHFSPIDTITERLTWIKELIKPNGRAFVSFNLETWLLYTEKEKINKLFGDFPEFTDVVHYVYQQILNANLNLLVNDWPILRISEESTIRDEYNGNIRLVFQR